MTDTRTIEFEFLSGAAPDFTPVYRVWQSCNVSGMDRTRKLGLVMYAAREKEPLFVSSVDVPEMDTRYTVGTSRDLPAAVEVLNAFHAMTRNQYAPWPKEEDEGEE